jgi:hypothetical protein
MCKLAFNTAGERHGMCESALTVLHLRFPVTFGVHFITNSGSVSPRIQAVIVTIGFNFPYAELLWFSFLPLRLAACFTHISEILTNPGLQVSRGD